MAPEKNSDRNEKARIAIYLAERVPEKIVAAPADGDSVEKVAEHQKLWDVFTKLARR